MINRSVIRFSAESIFSSLALDGPFFSLFTFFCAVLGSSGEVFRAGRGRDRGGVMDTIVAADADGMDDESAVAEAD